MSRPFGKFVAKTGGSAQPGVKCAFCIREVNVAPYQGVKNAVCMYCYAEGKRIPKDE